MTVFFDLKVSLCQHRTTITLKSRRITPGDMYASLKSLDRSMSCFTRRNLLLSGKQHYFQAQTRWLSLAASPFPQTQFDRQSKGRGQPLWSIRALQPPLRVTNIHTTAIRGRSSDYYTMQLKLKKAAYIALGSNIGDRLQMIEAACKLMDNRDDISIIATSCLWETKAMYVEDQPHFLNGVVKIETSLEPTALLDRLQSIEKELGRVRTEDKGPRNIDLDILIYGNSIVETERLRIPHQLMREREFVLRPLAQIEPSLEIPGTGKKVAQYIKELSGKSGPTTTPMSTQFLLQPSIPSLTPLLPTKKTQVMSILNMTPDSFSDGGVHFASDKDYLRRTIQAHCDAGATILDIGGQSTRPGASSVSGYEEFNRVLPAIQVAKEMGVNMAISVDTYRASVAEEAIKAGAHIINDISAGTLDPAMFSTIARLGCTYIMMHMRGTPETMMNEKNTTYDNLVTSVIRKELNERLTAAGAAGIRRWRIILDPGIGFAKNQPQNLEILRRFHQLRTGHPKLHGMAWLVGASRKKFIGRITGVEEPKDRTWGTAAAVTAAIEGGADIVRVHDVDAMVKVIKMADAIYRQ